MSTKRLLKHKVTKGCPVCELQVAVACKACPGCQHSFAKKSALPASAVLETNGRRTQRAKREKPNYYDASEYERKTRKRLDRRALDAPRERGRPPTSALNKKKKKKKLAKKDEDDEPPPVLTTEKQRQCSVILAELNRKFMTTAVRL
ncbi:Hypothetical protein NTJ_08449 [Nesidiocoris tenuis]|uniref:Uncharacterized protein n=1 Tax=Nesidiocoris tenuis TaxID=355587 RepID=A0ABN7AXG3_9HEMI|nr:Hypothetical protein NTJ_08449 [Nesidiocoris tenuis]